MSAESKPLWVVSGDVAINTERRVEVEYFPDDDSFQVELVIQSESDFGGERAVYATLPGVVLDMLRPDSED